MQSGSVRFSQSRGLRYNAEWFSQVQSEQSSPLQCRAVQSGSVRAELSLTMQSDSVSARYNAELSLTMQSGSVSARYNAELSLTMQSGSVSARYNAELSLTTVSYTHLRAHET